MKICEAQKLAGDLMREHGLAGLGWQFGWDRARRRFGCCHYRERLITLSVPLTIHEPDDARVKNTILHEIAHALVGPGHHHGFVWRKQARAIGCTAERCSASVAIDRVPHRFIGTCTTCGWEVKRDRRVAKRLFHPACHVRGTDRGLLSWRVNQ